MSDESVVCGDGGKDGWRHMAVDGMELHKLVGGTATVRQRKLDFEAGAGMKFPNQWKQEGKFDIVNILVFLKQIWMNSYIIIRNNKNVTMWGR